MVSLIKGHMTELADKRLLASMYQFVAFTVPGGFENFVAKFALIGGHG